MSANTMRAAHAIRYGQGKDVIEIVNNAVIPEIHNHQILVKVKAASVNPLDCKILNGKMPLMFKKQLPYIPGFDYSGLVVKVGSHVKKFKVGDRVFGDSLTGTFAEYTAADEKSAIILPESISFEDGASIPMAGLTAYQCAKWAQVKQGSRVLVLGGGGGVGHFAIQIVKLMGASFVATTGSNTSASFLQKVGADLVIDRHTQDFVEVLKDQKIDVVIDCVGGTPELWVKSQKILTRSTGSFVTVAGEYPPDATFSGGVALSVMTKLVWRKFISNFGRNNYNFTFCNLEDLKGLELLSQWAVEGKLRPAIQQVLSLSDAGSVLQASSEGRIKGKLVIKVSDS